MKFLYLSEFETFCKFTEYGTIEKTYEREVYLKQANFGIGDIIFYDKERDCLLWTTTHEEYINF